MIFSPQSWAACLVALIIPVASAREVPEVTLMVSPADRNRPAWKALEEEFNRENPDVRFRIIWSDISRKMHLLAAANALPDLVLTTDFSLVAYHRIFRNLNDFFATETGAEADYYPSLLDACHYDGNLKLIPLFYNAPFFYYRPDLLKEVGLPFPGENWTWETYREAARKLTVHTPAGRVLRYGTNVDAVWWVEWLSLIRQAGGELFDNRGNLTIDQSATRQAVEFMHDLIHADRSAPPPGDAPLGGFASGKYALYFGGHVAELAVLADTVAFQWDIAPLPAGPRGRSTGELAVVGLGITRNARHPEAAGRVLHFLSSKQAGEELIRAQLPPARRSLAPLFVSQKNEKSPWNRQALLDTLQFARSVPKTADFSPLAQNSITPAFASALSRPDRAALASFPERLQRDAQGYLKSMGAKPSANPVWFWLQIAALLVLLGAVIRRFLNRSSGEASSRVSPRYFFLFTAPCLLGLALLVIGPMALSFWWAQCEYDLVTPARYVGWQQYAGLLFADPDFWHSLKLSLQFALFAVPLGLAASLGAALLLNQNVRGIGFFRTIFYLPNILPVAASGIMWVWFLNPGQGAFNQLLALLGIEGPAWLKDPTWVLPSLILISAWNFGSAMLIFLAGLKNIPEALYEAAQIDGAGYLSQFFHITIPSLAPVIFFNLTMGLIGALQVFDLAYVVNTVSGGSLAGPEKSAYFYVLNLYDKAFVHLNIGVGSAMAWFFFFIVLAITLLNNRAKRLWWQEDSAA